MGTATLNQIQNAQPNAPAVQAAQSSTTAPVVASVSFGRAGKRYISVGPSQVLAPAAWVPGATAEVDIPTYGFMSGALLTFNATGGVNGTKTVAVNADAPWSLIATHQVTDVNGTPMWTLDGYAAFLAMLLGGYNTFRPDQSVYGYSAPSTGAAGTGNFLFKQYYPFEFATDGLGCLPNMDASAKYRINLTFRDPSVFFVGTAGEPGTLPSINVIPELFARSRPPATNRAGKKQATNPPALGTTQYWTSQIAQVSSGDNTIELKRTGNIIRNHILIFRDSSGVRATADSTGVTPPTIQLKYDAGVKYNARVDTLRQSNFWHYGFDMPAGVIALPYTNDPDGIPGHEYGDEWVATTGSTLLELDFTSSAAGTLQILTNDIVTPSQDLYSAAAMDIIGA